jgi:hypothetical protein
VSLILTMAMAMALALSSRFNPLSLAMIDRIMICVYLDVPFNTSHLLCDECSMLASSSSTYSGYFSEIFA